MTEEEKKKRKSAPAKPRKTAAKKKQEEEKPLERPELQPHPVEAPKEAKPKKTEEEKAKPQEFENDLVKVVVHRRPKCRIELEVHAKQPLVAAAHKKGIRAVSKQVVIPGFRKGKAPDDLVLKKYPRDVNKSWEQAIADDAFRESQHLAKAPILDTRSQVQFKMNKFSLADGADLSLSFETTPEPPSVDPKTLALEPIEHPHVDDQKIDEAIHQVRFYFAKWKKTDNRPIKRGDYIILDLEDIEASPPVKVYQNTRFEVSDERMAKWMQEVVLGMQIGESKEGVSLPDDSASEEEKKEFKPKKVRITITAIEECELPPIDEKFAQNLGVKTVEEIRKNVATLLQKQIDRHVQSRLREQASEFLLNKHPFELPPSLIEKEARFRLEQLGRDPKFLQFWHERNEAERKNIVDEIYQQAEKAVRMFYLCRKVVEEAKITITADDIPKQGSTPLEILLQPSSESHFHQQSDIGHAETYSRLIMEKAEDFIINHAQKPELLKK